LQIATLYTTTIIIW